MTPPPPTPSTERCERCDRSECPFPAAWRATRGIPGHMQDRTPEDDAKWATLGEAVLACTPLTTEQWRARCLASEAREAAMAERLSFLADAFDDEARYQPSCRVGRAWRSALEDAARKVRDALTASPDDGAKEI